MISVPDNLIHELARHLPMILESMPKAPPGKLRLLNAIRVTKTYKPSLDDYTTIKTYEDACEALGIEPNFNRDKLVFAEEDLEDLERVPKHIIALMKLETISYALWGRDFQPQPDGEGSKVYWFPWFALYSQDEINNIDDERRGALLAAFACYGASAGFGCLGADSRSSYAGAGFGFRLCQETEEKAEYFGKQFIQLWADYLAFNFTVGDPLK